MAKHSISEAARTWGKGRKTIQRHIASGKLSKEDDAKGNPVIDTSEMVRVYGPPKMTQEQKVRQTESVTQLDAPNDASDTVSEIELLKLKLEHAERDTEIERERRREAEKRVEEERAEKERLFTLVKSTTRLLEAPKQQPEPITPQQPEKKPGLWQRLTGG